MQIEQENPSPQSWDEVLKTTITSYQKAEKDGKKLPVTCINDFADILSLYLTSGELTPGEFMGLVISVQIKHQSQSHGTTVTWFVIGNTSMK
jgi:hypothetical protein